MSRMHDRIFNRLGICVAELAMRPTFVIMIVLGTLWHQNLPIPGHVIPESESLKISSELQFFAHLWQRVSGSQGLLTAGIDVRMTQ